MALIGPQLTVRQEKLRWITLLLMFPLICGEVWWFTSSFDAEGRIESWKAIFFLLGIPILNCFACFPFIWFVRKFIAPKIKGDDNDSPTESGTV